MSRVLLVTLGFICLLAPWASSQIVIPVPVPDPAGPYFDLPPTTFTIPPFSNRSDLIVNDSDRVEVYLSLSGLVDQVAVFQDYIDSRFVRALSHTQFSNPTTMRLLQTDNENGYQIIVASDSLTLQESGGDGYSINRIQFDGGNLRPEAFATNVLYEHSTDSEFPPQMAVSDVDQDGDEDVLVNFPTPLSNETPSVVLLRNDGEDGFTPLETGINLPGDNRNARRMLLHDLNLDSIPDLVFLLEFFSDQRGVLIFEGNGDGTFTERALIQPPDFPLNVEIYPFIEESLPGLVVHNSQLPDQSSIYRFRQSAPFEFEPVGEPVPVGALSYDMKVVDLNQDGTSDVAVSFGDLVFGTASMRILKYQSSVPDPVVIQDIPLGVIPGKIAFTDLNGDQFVDLVYAGILSVQNQNENLTVLLQRPVWVTPTPLPTQTPTPTPDATNTPLPTATFTPSPTPSQTHTPTQTPTQTPTHTPTVTPTPSPTNTMIPTPIPSPTPSLTPTHTPTNTATQTPTEIPTQTPTPSSTATPTITPTPSPVVTPTPLPFDLDRFRNQYTRWDVENVGQGIRDLLFADLWNEGQERLFVVAGGEDIVRSIVWQEGTLPEVEPVFQDDDPVSLIVSSAVGSPLLILASQGGPHVSLLQPQAPGEVSLLERISVLVPPLSIQELDFTLDGLPDLVLQSDLEGEVSVLQRSSGNEFSLDEAVPIGDGTTAFDSLVTPAGQSFIASVNSSSRRLTLLRILSGGLLVPQGDYAAGVEPVAVQAGRIDEDENPDVAIADRAGSAVVVWTTNGSSTLQQRMDLTLAESPATIALDDLTLDGLDDIVVAGARDESVVMYVEQLWQDPVRFETAMRAALVATGDMNGDGVPDFAAAASNDTRVTLYVSQNATAIHNWFLFE